MLNDKDLLSILTGERGKLARQILKDTNNPDLTLTIYSTNPTIIERIITDNDKTEIFDLIIQANKSNKDIETVIFERQYRAKQEAPLEQFFNAFDNPDTKERLFILIGETGVGKSYMVEKRYSNLPIWNCNKALEPYDLCYFLADTDGTGLKPHETPFLKCVRGELKDNRIIMDEFNNLPFDTLMFIQGLTDEKKSIVLFDKRIEISPSFRILATQNPPSKTDDRQPLGDALLGRSVGYVLEMTDEMIVERLGASMKWLQLVREQYREIQASHMTDIRELDYRDFQKFFKYDYESQLKYKVSQGDVENIAKFNQIASTSEYQEKTQAILIERENIRNANL